MNRSRNILLVEDNPYDVELTLRAFAQSNIMNELVVVRDGKEALDYLFGAGAYAGRDLGDAPEVVLLDLKLPKVDGLEVLRRMRADERTRRQPVVVLTSSGEEKDVVSSYNWTSPSSPKRPSSSASTGWSSTSRLREIQSSFTPRRLPMPPQSLTAPPRGP